MRARPSGGKRDAEGKITPNDLDRVHEGQRVGIAVRPAVALVHQMDEGEMGQQKAVELLPSPGGASAASRARRAASP